MYTRGATQWCCQGVEGNKDGCEFKTWSGAILRVGFCKFSPGLCGFFSFLQQYKNMCVRVWRCVCECGRLFASLWPCDELATCPGGAPYLDPARGGLDEDTLLFLCNHRIRIRYTSHNFTVQPGDFWEPAASTGEGNSSCRLTTASERRRRRRKK